MLYTVVKKNMKENHMPFHAPSLLNMPCFAIFHRDESRGTYNYLHMHAGEPRWGACTGRHEDSLSPTEFVVDAKTCVSDGLEVTSATWARPFLMSWETMSNHREYIKVTTKGVDVGIVCTLQSPALRTLRDAMKDKQNSFSCTSWPVEFDDGPGREMVLREFGLFCFREERGVTSLAYVHMVNSMQHTGSNMSRDRIILTEKGDAAIYHQPGNEWVLTTVSDGAAGEAEVESYLTTGMWTGAAGKITSTPVMVCDQQGAEFAAGDDMQADQLEAVRDMSSENMVYITPTYVNHSHTLFKHCRSLTLFAPGADGHGIEPLWSQSSPGPGRSVESATTWMMRGGSSSLA
jgi:hypothetical protein